VAVAHCPESNAKLASGVAPLVEFLACGIPVGLGTDDPASHNDLDRWEDMRFAAMVAAWARANMMLVNLGAPAFVPWLEDAQLIEHRLGRHRADR
jgi:5-methylthioadenosine/S-adenosylhomocysteine deaminase